LEVFLHSSAGAISPDSTLSRSSCVTVISNGSACGVRPGGGRSGRQAKAA
jgi:hypothetical protein